MLAQIAFTFLAVCAIIPVQSFPADQLRSKIEVEERNLETTSSGNVLTNNMLLNEAGPDIDNNNSQTEENTLAGDISTDNLPITSASITISPGKLLTALLSTLTSTSTPVLDTSSKNDESTDYSFSTTTESKSSMSTEVVTESFTTTATAPTTRNYIAQTTSTLDASKIRDTNEDSLYRTSPITIDSTRGPEYLTQTTIKPNAAMNIGQEYYVFTTKFPETMPPLHVETTQTSEASEMTFNCPAISNGVSNKSKSKTSMQPSMDDSYSSEISEDEQELMYKPMKYPNGPCSVEIFPDDLNIKSYCQFWSQGRNYYEFNLDYINCLMFQYSLYDDYDC